MKSKTFKKIYRRAIIVYFILNIMFGAWAIGSYIDIVVDNHTPNPQHSEYNLFVMMTEANK
jgi:hypothetical protein